MSSNSEKRRQLRTQRRFHNDDSESRNRLEKANKCTESADVEEGRSCCFGFDTSLVYDENALNNCVVSGTPSDTASNRRKMTNGSEQANKESNQSNLTGNNNCVPSFENTVDEKVNEAPSSPVKQNMKYSKHGVVTKSAYCYEPTVLKDIPCNEEKPVQISIHGWHTLSTGPSGESNIYYDPNFLGKEDQERYFQYLETEINWQTKEISLDGNLYIQPRLVAWFGPYPYGYSGVLLETNTVFPEIVREIKNKIETSLKEKGRGVTFNSVLLNRYRDGKDSVAWHSDDEFSLGVDPTIASVSLGEVRKFEMKPKALTKEKDQKEQLKKDEAEKFISLGSGSLLVMDGVMQKDWLHRVPKESRSKEGRINLTFRTVYPTEETSIDRKLQQNRRKR